MVFWFACALSYRDNLKGQVEFRQKKYILHLNTTLYTKSIMTNLTLAECVQLSKDKGIALKGGLKPCQILDGIELFHTVQILDQHMPDWSTDWSEEKLNLTVGLLHRWSVAMGASYYADEKEDFFLFKAAELAKKEGKRRVIMEDLS
jgi:hypothetical protein